MNKKHDRKPRTEEVEVVNEEVNCVSREEVKNALRRMKTGKPGWARRVFSKSLEVQEMEIKFLI